MRFIEFMDVGNHNKWSIKRVVSGNEILNIIMSEFDVAPIDLSSSQEVAKRYRYLDDSCEFGLITSVSQTFCGSCTRVRVSADGKLFTCLFSSNGLDLKTFLRSEEYDKSEADRSRLTDNRHRIDANKLQQKLDSGYYDKPENRNEFWVDWENSNGNPHARKVFAGSLGYKSEYINENTINLIY